eukprot:scaffold6293_cov133-Isochrysis_galbana.AAC.3
MDRCRKSVDTGLLPVRGHRVAAQPHNQPKGSKKSKATSTPRSRNSTTRTSPSRSGSPRRTARTPSGGARLSTRPRWARPQ